MEQLEQLKHMRDEARKRIAATADYKLATSLDSLIADLEEVLGVPSDDGEGAEGTDDAEADIEPAAASEETTTEVVVEVAEETVEEAKSEDDVSDLSRALAQQLENETATMSKAATADDEPLIPPAAPTNGSSAHSENEDAAEDGEEEDALIRAMRELDEDLANADLGDDAKGAK